jgi:hypothetical protein
VRLVHSARASRAVERPVTCEECGTQYVYVLEREARVYGFSSILDHLTGRAQQQAEEFAERALERKLRLACDVAPCPKCGHVQRDMVRERDAGISVGSGRPGGGSRPSSSRSAYATGSPRSRPTNPA